MNQGAGIVSAVIDACVLAGALRRDLVLSLAFARTFEPLWSTRILDETRLAILRMTGSVEESVRHIAEIEAVFPKARVKNFEHLESELSLPDPNDNHVLAAAIKGQAQIIATDNLKDFPDKILKPYSVQPMSTDHFLVHVIELNEQRALASIKQMRKRWSKPAHSSASMIRYLGKHGLHRTAGKLEKYLHLV